MPAIWPDDQFKRWCFSSSPGFFLIPYFNLGTVLRRGGKRITTCSALVQQCERLDTEQKYIVFWGTRSELMANWKVSQNPIPSGVVHQGRVGSGGRSCACFCFWSCVKLTGQNCIRTFILIHFYWLLQKESHCLWTELYKLDLASDVFCEFCFFALFILFVSSLHTGEHTKNGNELHMI